MVEVFGTEFRKAYYLFKKMQLSGAFIRLAVRQVNAAGGWVIQTFYTYIAILEKRVPRLAKPRPEERRR
jgi:hypothetical protein